MERPAISSGPALMIPAGYPRDLPSALVNAARNFPEAGVVEVGPSGRPTRLDNPILLELAARILSGLRANGVGPGDTAIVHCAEPIGFLASFWACALGGVRPLLTAQSAHGDKSGEGRERLARIAGSLGRPVLIGRPSDLPSDLGPVLDPDALAGHEPATEFHRPAPDDVAVLMMSSGSTGTPKLIQLTHRGLVEFAAGTPAMLPIRPGQVTLNWLPLDHSGAFLLYHVLPVFAGCTNVHAATDWMLADPLRWLDLMAAHRVNHSWAPNFAYRLVTAAVTGDPDRHWDLSALRSLVSGGEQITVPVVAEFLRVTSRFGVVPETFVPAWGMTETVTGITFARPGLAANVHRVRIAADGAVEWLDKRVPSTVTVAHPTGPGAVPPPAVSLVSVGTPAPGATVRVVGTDGRVLPEGRVGRLQVASARVTPGYLGDPAADRAAFPIGDWTPRKWLATGDQAFITGGQLVITGRDGDRIIVNGHNYAAQDIEAVAATAGVVQDGLVAACGIPDPALGTDRLVLFYAVEGEPVAGAADALRSLVHERFGLAAHLVAVPRRSFPQSAGGKLLRPVLKDRWLDDTLLDPDPVATTAEISEDEGEATTELPRITNGVAANGTADGTSNGTANGTADGTSNGTANGTADGAGGNGTATVLALGNYRDGRPGPEHGGQQAAGVEPIAIIGMAARLPGASTLEQFWENLAGGVESIRRDPDGEGEPHGVLDDLDAFDAGFFGIAPREAALTDPAQRLFLEVCHHALEHGGYAGGVAGRIGLFAGSGGSPQGTADAAPGGDVQAERPDFLATRVAHRLGLTGPAIGVQTAGSSALVAVHLACQALRSGDADLALAGAADGTVGGSGVAAVLLKRLDRALADGDTVHAVIRGSAVSEAVADAGVSGQVEVVERALEQAGVGAIGSVKPNIGHLDSAAGVAGLLKVVLMLKHRTLVPTIHHLQPADGLDLAGSPFVVGTELRAWSTDGAPLRAGVSALVAGGTNAHVIVEEAPPAVRRGADGPVVLALSAAEPEALTDLAGQLREVLAGGPEHRLTDIAGTIALGRAARRHRLAVAGSTADELAAALEGAEPAEVPRGGPGPLGFAFTGQGAARRGMAAGLAARFPVFRAALEECDAVYAEEAGGSLLGLLLTPAGAETVWPTETAQPALFAFEVALARLWRSFGVEPALVVGHSVGEYAALCVAGALSLPDGMRLTTRRGRLLQQGTAPGAMVAVRADADRVRELVQTPGVEIAAGNGPQMFVLTGAEVVVGQLAEKLDRLEDVAWQRIDVDRAFHSSLLDPILDDFAEAAADITLHPLRTPMVSTWSGDLLETDTVLDVEYLVGQLREPVLFGAAVEALTAAGCRRFLELGPDAVLSPAGRRIAPNSTWIPTQRLGQDPVLATMNGLAELYRQGTDITWAKVFADAGRVPLPAYPFRQVRHRLERPVTDGGTAGVEDAPQPPPRIDLAGGVPGGFAPAAADPDAGATRYQAALEVILDLTAEQLGIDPLDITSDHTFLELGADSMSMLRVVQEMRQRFNVELEMRELFTRLDTPHRLATAVASGEPVPAEVTAAQSALTVLGDGLAELVAKVEAAPIAPEGPGVTRLMAEQLRVAARLVDQVTGLMRDQLALLGRSEATPVTAVEPAESLPEASSSPVAAESPLTPAQRGVWFVEQLYPGSSAHHDPRLVRLDGPLDVDRLRAAFGRVVERQAALRTVVDIVDGELVQRVTGPGAVDLPLVVAEGIDEVSVVRGVLADLTGPFDLAAGPLLRARIVRLAADRHLLVLVVHRLVFDSFSAQVLVRELAACYRGDDLPALGTDYPSYAQARLAEPDVKTADLAYWRSVLADSEALRLPTDRPRPRVASLAGASLVHDLDAGLGDAVAGFSREHRVTPFMTLLAAVGAVLGRFAGQQDLVVGTILSNRPAGTEDLVGLLADPVPLRIDLSGEPTLAELAGRVREATIGAVDHLGAGFDELVAELDPVRDPGRNPVFQVLVEYESTAEVPFARPALRATLIDVPADRAPFDLTLRLTQHADGIRCTAEYSTDLYDEVTVRRLLEYVEAVLRRATGSGATPLAVLTAPTAADRAVLDRWSGTPANEPAAGLHTLFEQQVARTPEAVALSDGAREITYAELEQRANAVAWQLVDLGVEPDQLVAIRQDRGVGSVVAVLAVLKAGAAYLPLDADLPEETWAELVSDAGAVALVGDDAALADRLGLRLMPVGAGGRDPRARQAPAVQPEPGRLAYCVYGMDPAGEPRGVAVPHRGPANVVSHFLRERPALRTLQWSSTGSYTHALELFSTLASGAALVLLPEEARAEGALATALQEYGVERLVLPQAELVALLASGPLLPGLREIVAVGTRLVVTEAVRRFLASHPDCVLSSGYGAVETSVVATVQQVDGSEELPAIGRPIEGVLVRVLDERAAGGDVLIGGGLNDGLAVEAVVVDVAPLTSTQARCLRLHQASERPAVYNLAHRVVLTGDLDPAALEHSLWTLVDRHPALRTRIVERADGPVQEVLDQVPVSLPVEDLGMATDDGTGWSRSLAAEGIEPGEAPLWRARLGRLSEDRWVLVLVVHHLICDDWSLALLWSELSTVYGEVLEGETSPLAPAAAYTEYTRWRLGEAARRRTELEKFWRTELDGAPSHLDLPYDRPRPERLSGRGEVHRFTVPAQTAARLDRVAEKLGSTRAAVLTAAYGVWMARLCDQRDLVIAVSNAGRVRPEHANTMGPVGEAVLVRLSLGAEIRFADLVAQVGTRTFRALDHHVLGLGEVYRVVAPDRPLESPQVLLTVVTTPPARLELPGVAAEIEALGSPEVARTELYVVLTPTADGITGTFEYSTDLFDAGTVQGWESGLLGVLDELAQRPGGIL